jgi:cytoskeletal protein CcmA (bactofilin family)
MNDESNTDLPNGTSTQPVSEKTIIANSFTIEGELVAKEDTMIQGRVDGSILVEDHTVRIGKEGHVSGEILAKNVIVEGTINGRLSAKETVVLRKQAEVQGEILSPRVAMEEGCKFNGQVKMESVASTPSQRKTKLIH